MKYLSIMTAIKLVRINSSTVEFPGAWGSVVVKALRY